MHGPQGCLSTMKYLEILRATCSAYQMGIWNGTRIIIFEHIENPAKEKMTKSKVPKSTYFSVGKRRGAR